MEAWVVRVDCVGRGGYELPVGSRSDFLEVWRSSEYETGNLPIRLE